MKKYLFLLASLILASCGNNNDCPSGTNTTNPNCPNYVATQTYPYGNGQVQCQPGTPNCVNGYYQYPNGQYPNGQYPNNQYPNYGQPTPCQVGTPNCVNGYYQYPNYGQPTPCQIGTPYCVNGYYQYPQQPYPYYGQPNPYYR